MISVAFLNHLKLVFMFKPFGKKGEPGVIDHPPFPVLIWNNKYKWWEGIAQLPAWQGFQSCGGTYGAQDSDKASDGSAAITVTPHSAGETIPPTDAQSRGFQFQLDHGPEVVCAVLETLMPFYQRLRAEWDLPEEPLREVTSPEQFRQMMGLSQIHVHPYYRDGLAYIGLEFGCDWDLEHGFGVMLHGARVVEFGYAAAAFEQQPDEAQST